MLPLLKQAALGETRVPAVADKLADDLGITAEESRSASPKWATENSSQSHSLVQALYGEGGLIDLPQRGRFVASQKGRDLLARNPDKINLDMLLEYPSFREWYRGSNVGDAGGLHTEELASTGLRGGVEKQRAPSYLTTYQAVYGR